VSPSIMIVPPAPVAVLPELELLLVPPEEEEEELLLEPWSLFPPVPEWSVPDPHANGAIRNPSSSTRRSQP
jgi:hypothetical protein